MKKFTSLALMLNLTACNGRRVPYLTKKMRGQKRRIEELSDAGIQKKIPLGKTDFKQIIEGGYVYKDNTKFIEEFWERGAEVTVLNRPGGFGKTLMLSTCEHFFDIRKKKENSRLFNGLYISRSECYKEQGAHPVISLSFKDIRMDDWNECKGAIAELIGEEYSKHAYLMDSDKLNETDKKKFAKLKDREANFPQLQNSLKYLIKYLRLHNEKKVIVLLDEYDTPLIEGEQNKYYRQVNRFMTNLLSAGLKDNVNLNRGIMAGELMLSLTSFLGGLDSIRVCGVTSVLYGDKFGFKEGEVREILEKNGLEEKFEDVKKWYGGYNIGGEELYNPSSILYCVDEKKILNSWMERHKNEHMRRWIRKLLYCKSGWLHTSSALYKLIRGEKVEVMLKHNLNTMDGEEANALSLMLSTGYLSFEELEMCEGGKKLKLKIPNQEMRNLFSYILEELREHKYK